MALSPGTRLGPYEILGVAGSGGMGEVYQATDTRLDRTVAVKVLPEAALRDPARRQRLEREARAISSLSHPHICTLYDVGHQDGIDYLVMEFLDGETLDERLARGGLPPDQVLRYGIEIADALDAAHRRGLVHRDLKPGNIMLTRTGSKLLDFGLAREDAAERTTTAISNTATRTRALTAEGTVVGTIDYMSPEQLEGRPVDARSDLFCFGAVLYEMATGRKAFQGQSQASVIAAILTSEPPPLATVQPLAPPALERALRRCLAKDPEERWQSARDLMLELKWIAGTDPREASAASGPSIVRRRERVFMALTIVLATGTLFLALPRFRPGGPGLEPAIRASILPPEKSHFIFGGLASGPMEMSPDGRSLTFVARTVEGSDRLWVRPLDAPSARVLEGTEGASFPFWAPDSRFIGFFADSKLKKIDSRGGPPQTLCNVSIARGGTWNTDGTILFAPDVSDALYRVPSSGGEPVPVTQIDPARHQMNHRWPQFLPDGRHFLFFARSSSGEGTGTYTGSLDSTAQTMLMAGQSNAIYAPPGYVLFVREGALMAQAFDANGLKLTGDPRPVADPVTVNGSVQNTIVSVSENGILAYQAGKFTSGFHMFWFDRGGKSLASIGEPAIYIFPRLSPDGKRLAVQVTDLRSGNSDLWIHDLARGVKTRFTFEPSIETYPVWSPDGTRIVFASNRTGRFHMFVKSSDGVGDERPLVEEPDADARPLSWSPDGRYIAFMRRQLK